MAFSIEVSGNRERPLWGNRERPQNTLKPDAHLLKMKIKWYFSTRIYQKLSIAKEYRLTKITVAKQEFLILHERLST